MAPDSDRLAAGRDILRQLGLGDETPFNLDDEFFQHTTAELFGTLFTRPGLTLRERELITIAVIVAVGGTYGNLSFHLKAAPHVGITEDQLREVILQAMYYAGWPKGANAIGILKQFKAETAAGAKAAASANSSLP